MAHADTRSERFMVRRADRLPVDDLVTVGKGKGKGKGNPGRLRPMVLYPLADLQGEHERLALLANLLQSWPTDTANSKSTF